MRDRRFSQVGTLHIAAREGVITQLILFGTEWIPISQIVKTSSRYQGTGESGWMARALFRFGYDVGACRHLCQHGPILLNPSHHPPSNHIITDNFSRNTSCRSPTNQTPNACSNICFNAPPHMILNLQATAHGYYCSASLLHLSSCGRNPFLFLKMCSPHFFPQSRIVLREFPLSLMASSTIMRFV